MTLDRSSQKWGFAFMLSVLALSNVIHPVVNDPTRMFENLPYDLFPQGVLNNQTASESPSSPNADVSNNPSSDANKMITENQATIPSEHSSATTIESNYSALDHVVMRFRNDPSSVTIQPNSVPVMLWPFQDQGWKVDSADMTHIETNGVQESSVLYLAPKAVRTLDPNVVWLTDVKFPPSEWCKRLTQKAELTKARRQAAGLPLQWPIFVVDFTDQRTYHRCKGLELIVGKEFMFYSKRSVVVDRVFDSSQNWVTLGTKVLEQRNMTYEHMPLVVRTDIVEILKRILLHRYNKTKLSDPIETLWNRSVDIAHYWPSDGRSGIGRFQSQLRDKVSQTIETALLGTTKQIFVGVTGTADRRGRRKPQTAYVRHMLTTKIVVVTQRDEWEGHYRLYEALLSGAMVMSDQMLILSRLGLENGTSVIEFDSETSLISLAQYYLDHNSERQAIASRGRQIAMSRHRSWHRMEEIVFGSIVTKCTAKECPYIVHGNESSIVSS
ncbi:unnamed protein product [Cylindrotheca closterium]|uniref:Spore protein YkvP/CgeB glycosyl transferase-like domain-containing protein n=1 Tax=Cylindrotheca closterium TaxID=2856 RepID=A0AAD2JMR2_9STRA|nr:unnamed protein product [Cylindrotheca closterium]